LFTLGGYFLIAEVAHKFGELLTINVDEKCVALHLFTNLSGHPESETKNIKHAIIVLK
jgi:hypothetical protein